METFKIAIKPLGEAYREFEETYQALEAGKPATKHEGVYFTSLNAARKLLTQERLSLLRVIREKQPTSIYELARLIGRDLKNVQEDLALLHSHGLVRLRQRKDNRRGAKVPEVPFQEIALSISL